MADTAALVVALSAQLTKFERDMKGAVDIANKRTKEIESSFDKMNKSISGQLSSLANFGPLGATVGRLGPIGLAAAAGIGALTVAFQFLNRQVQDYIQRAGQLRDAADATGLSISQLRELSRIGIGVGASGEQVEKAVIKMTVAIEELRKGSGPLFDTLRKIPGALEAVASAEDPAKAIDALIAAFNRLGTEFEKNAFLRQAFGRDPAFGRIFRQMAEKGGLSSIMQDAKASTEGLVKEIDDLDDKIKELERDASDLWGEAFGKDVLQARKDLAEYRVELARLASDIAANFRSGQSAGGAVFRAIRNRLFGDTSGFSGITTGPTPEQAGIATRAEREAAANFPLPTARPQIGGEPLDVTIKKLKDTISALGTAATAEQKLRLERLEAKKNLEDRVLTEEQYRQKLGEIAQQESITTLQLKERLGIATEEELLRVRELQFYRDSRDLKLDATQIEQGLTKARKEGQEAIEQQLVSLSKLPGAMRAGLDAANAFKNLDQALTSTASNFENAFADIAVGTKSLKDAFKDLTDSIIRDLVRMAIRMSITGPLLKSLGGLFGGGAGAGFSFGAGGIGHAQHGGPVRAGRPYVVGEAGPELFVPKSSGQIVPSSVSKGSMGAGYKVTVNNYASNDTTSTQERQQGPDGEELIIGIVKKRMASGGFDDINQGRYGLRARKVR